MLLLQKITPFYLNLFDESENKIQHLCTQKKITKIIALISN